MIKADEKQAYQFDSNDKRQFAVMFHLDNTEHQLQWMTDENNTVRQFSTEKAAKQTATIERKKLPAELIHQVYIIRLGFEEYEDDILSTWSRVDKKWVDTWTL